MRDINDLLVLLSVIALDSRLARLAAELRRTIGLKVPDSAIAATAIFTNSTLITRNISDFRRVPSLQLMKI